MSCENAAGLAHGKERPPPRPPAPYARLRLLPLPGLQLLLREAAVRSFVVGHGAGDASNRPPP